MWDLGYRIYNLGCGEVSEEVFNRKSSGRLCLLELLQRLRN